jgi:hypothetical protein
MVALSLCFNTAATPTFNGSFIKCFLQNRYPAQIYIFLYIQIIRQTYYFTDCFNANRVRIIVRNILFISY